MIRILFLAANPIDQAHLHVRQEFDELRQALDSAAHGRRFVLIQEFAAAPDQLQALLFRHQPQIVHFSGHGTDGGLVFEGANGSSHLVAPQTLHDLFTGFRTTVRCVVLNACYSESQAAAIATVIDSVVGMSDVLTDDAACGFAVAFHRALANGTTLADAVGLGRNQLDLQGLDEAHKPQLLAGRIDPSQVRALDWDDGAPTTPTTTARAIKINIPDGSVVEQDLNIDKGDFVGHDKIEYHHYYYTDRPVPTATTRALSTVEQKIRTRYLDELQKDVQARLKVSIHRARFIEIGIIEDPYATYLPWRYRAPNEQVEYTSFQDAFVSIQRRLLLLGAPGAGKSTVLLHIAELLIQEAMADPQAPIPLLLNLTQVPRAGTQPNNSWLRQRAGQVTMEATSAPNMEHWLARMMAEKYPFIARMQANQWMQEGRIAALLDGLDEVDEQHRIPLVETLNQTYLDTYSFTTAVICSRSIEYHRLRDSKIASSGKEGVGLHLEAVTLQPLRSEQINEYLEKAKATSLRTALLKDTALQELAQTPLTLSMMTLAYADLAPIDFGLGQSLWEQRRHLFDTYIHNMMQRHARRKAGIPFDLNPVNDQTTLYTRQQVDRTLGWLALRMSERAQTLLPLNYLYGFLKEQPIVKGKNNSTQLLWLTDTVVVCLLNLLSTLPLLPVIPFRFVYLLLMNLATICLYLLGRKVFDNRTNYVSAKSMVDKHPLREQLHRLILRPLTIVVLGAITIIVMGSFLTALPLSPIVILLLILDSVVILLSVNIVTITALKEFIHRIFYTAIPPAIRTEQEHQLHRVQWRFVITAIGSVLITGWLSLRLVGTLDWYEAITVLSATLLLTALIESKGVMLIIASLALLASLFGITSVVLVVSASIFFVLFLFITNQNYLQEFEKYISPIIDRYLLTQVLCQLLIAQRILPLRTRDFLNFTADIHLLKPAGNAQEFLHRLLRDHFATHALLPRLAAADQEQTIHLIGQLALQGEAAVEILSELAINHIDARVRQAAVAGVAQIATPAVFSLLEQILGDPSVHVRREVVRAAGRLIGDDKVFMLSRLLTDTDLGVRILALAALEATYDISTDMKKYGLSYTTILQNLSEFLQNSEDDIRGAAAKTLGAIGDVSSVPTLLQALTSKTSYVRCSTAWALGNIGDGSSVPALLQTLRDHDENVRYSAAQALVKCSKAGSVPALLHALHDRDGNVRRVAAAALVKCSDASSIPVLLQALNATDFHAYDDDVRMVIAKALEKLSDASSVSTLLQALRKRTLLFESNLDVSRTDVVRVMAEALVKCSNASSVPILLQALHDSNRDVYSVAAEALVKCSDASNVPILLQALHDSNRDVYSVAAEALVKCSDASNVPILLQALHDHDSTVRTAVAWALGEIDDASSIPTLLQALYDRDSTVRGIAARALGRLGDKRAVPDLINAMKDLTTVDAKGRRACDYAAQALHLIGTSEAQQAIIEWQKDQ